LTPLGTVQAQAMATKEVLILYFETDGSLKLPPVIRVHKGLGEKRR
jgi:hypothetical protein